MVIKKTRENGELFYVNVFTGKEEKAKRVAPSNPSNFFLEQVTKQKLGFYPRAKTKRERLIDKKSVYIKSLYDSIKTIGKKGFDKNQFILNCKRVNVNPYSLINN